jgi:hypothetical protein
MEEVMSGDGGMGATFDACKISLEVVNEKREQNVPDVPLNVNSVDFIGAMKVISAEGGGEGEAVFVRGPCAVEKDGKRTESFFGVFLVRDSARQVHAFWKRDFMKAYNLPNGQPIDGDLTNFEGTEYRTYFGVFRELLELRKRCQAEPGDYPSNDTQVKEIEIAKVLPLLMEHLESGSTGAIALKKDILESAIAHFAALDNSELNRPQSVPGPRGTRRLLR